MPLQIITKFERLASHYLSLLLRSHKSRGSTRHPGPSFVTPSAQKCIPPQSAILPRSYRLLGQLRHRAVRILQQAAGVDAETAQTALDATGYEVKPALVMLLAGIDADQARRHLAQANGFVRLAVDPA